MFPGRDDTTRCCDVDDVNVVALATEADGIVLPAVVMVTADDDNDDVEDDGTAEPGTAASAAAIPASRRLRIKPTHRIAKCQMHFPLNEKHNYQRGKIQNTFICLFFNTVNFAHHKS